MIIPQFLCPRIRLTKTDGSHAIIPIDAISGIEEDKHSKCVKICTMDGFWYEVINGIEEVDSKIDSAIEYVNKSVPIVIPNTSTDNKERMPLPYESSKASRFKKKRMLPAGIDKPDRRMADIAKGTKCSAETSAPPQNLGEDDKNGTPEKPSSDITEN